jgi:shikimate kinase
MSDQQQLKRIVIIGFMGAGKTTVGEEVARRLGLGFFDLDREVVVRSCFDSVRDIFEVCGEPFFRTREAQALSDLLQHEGVVVATGGGVVSNELATNDLGLAAQRGEVVYLKARFETLVGRVGGDPGRPLFREFNRARSLFDARQGSYSKYASLTLEVDNEPVEKIVETILNTVKMNAVLK